MSTMNVSLEVEVASGDPISASEDVRDAQARLLRREVGQGMADAEAGRFSDSSVEDIFDAVIEEPSS